MKIAPASPDAPGYPRLVTVLAATAAASLALSSCSLCPACQGSGLQFKLENGRTFPYLTGAYPTGQPRTVKTIACAHCQGKGEIPLYAQPQPKLSPEQNSPAAEGGKKASTP